MRQDQGTIPAFLAGGTHQEPRVVHEVPAARVLGRLVLVVPGQEEQVPVPEVGVVVPLVEGEGGHLAHQLAEDLVLGPILELDHHGAGPALPEVLGGDGGVLLDAQGHRPGLPHQVER